MKTPINLKQPMNKPLKVAIGVPSNDMIHADFAMCLANLVSYSFMQGIHVAVINQKSSIVEVGRCEIVGAAFQVNADKLLFLDSDMVFPFDALMRLIARNKDIIGCDAVRRREPFTQVVKDEEGKLIDHKNCEELVKLQGASTACLLIDMKVFKDIEKPYFLVEWLGDDRFLGEDYYFTKKVKEKGYDIFCDTKLSKQIGHIGVRTCYIEGSK